MLKELGEGLVIGHFQKIPQHSLFVLQNPTQAPFPFSLGTIVSTRRKWKQCPCKTLEEKQRVLWYYFFIFLKVAYWTLNLAISTENLDNVMTKFIIDKSTDP